MDEMVDTESSVLPALVQSDVNMDTGTAAGIAVDTDVAVGISLNTANPVLTASPVPVLEDANDEGRIRN